MSKQDYMSNVDAQIGNVFHNALSTSTQYWTSTKFQDAALANAMELKAPRGKVLQRLWGLESEKMLADIQETYYNNERIDPSEFNLQGTVTGRLDSTKSNKSNTPQYI